MTTSNRLGITELAETQNNRSVTVNEAIAKLEAGAFCFPAVSIGDTSPPGSPAEGDAYCLGAAPTGAWSGQATKVAVYYNAAWLFLPAIEGALAYAQDANAYYFFDTSTWSLLAGGGGAGDVVGPGSAVNSNIALFDTTTGKLLKDSGVAISTDGTLASNSDAKITTEKGVKTYIDGLALNLGKRGRVRVATTATITISTALNNGDSLDGVTLATGDLVLVKNQSAAEQNGIYVVGPSPARSSEFDTYNEHPGSLMIVEEGTVNDNTLWVCGSNEGGTLNTTAINFTQLVVTAPTTIEFSLFFASTFLANEVLAQHIVSRAFSLPAGLTGSHGVAIAAATASTVLTIKKNGSSVGTATWAVAGTTPTLAMASLTNFAIGDILTIVAPATPDATLANVSLSLLGSL
ncbi:DUF2793 domain-containing protein [Mesorhizobium cantuariense]|uniref:DUF2793 domain-containing protein n=1 Tax=Mesorhizobium cantuariense TaxID=1300275 RepID=A0ABV7MJU3_9HYPH